MATSYTKQEQVMFDNVIQAGAVSQGFLPGLDPFKRYVAPGHFSGVLFIHAGVLVAFRFFPQGYFIPDLLRPLIKPRYFRGH